MGLVERLREWADVFDPLIEGAAPTELLGEAADELERLQQLAESLEERLLEAEVRAHKWMEAHDKLKAGKPYRFPEPADVSRLQQRVEVLEGAMEMLFFRATQHEGFARSEENFAALEQAGAALGEGR